MTITVGQTVGSNMLHTAWKRVENNQNLHWVFATRKAENGIRQSIAEHRIAFSNERTDLAIQGNVHAAVYIVFGNATERMSRTAVQNLPWHERYNNAILSLIGIGVLNRQVDFSSENFALSLRNKQRGQNTELMTETYFNSVANHGINYWFIENNPLLEGRLREDVVKVAAVLLSIFIVLNIQ